MANSKKAKNGLPRHMRFGLYGLYIGFVLSRTGFADFSEVHQMFTFMDFNLFLTFCVGVGVSALAYWSLLRMRGIRSNQYHPGTISGGVIFGIGWAITGACPSIALVMIGGGQIAAFATLVGVLIGTWIYPKIHRRYFKWDSGVCGL